MKLLKHQGYHILLLALLLVGLYTLVTYDPKPACLKGSLFGVPTKSWLILAVLAPIIHQIYVLIIWRWELYYKGMTNLFGKHAFKIYKIGFIVLILSRVVTLILLAFANKHSFEISDRMMIGVTLFCLLPSAWLFYSVFQYFGIDRAFGIDHFTPKEARKWPMVNGGIFQFTNNGMYVFGFLALYIPALLLASKAALVVALFNHFYIWVHFYTTELPDMKEIYGE